MNIPLIKAVDGCIGRLLTRLLPMPLWRALNTHPLSALLIRPGGIGDAVLLAPLINIIKNLYPAIQITILAERRNAGLFDLIPSVDKVYCYDRPAEFMRAVRGSYDLVIDTEQWHRLSAVVARLIRAPMKIGFGTNERRRMFTHSVSYSHDDYEAVSFIRLLEPLSDSCTVSDNPAPFLTVPSDAALAAEELLKPLGGAPFVVLFSGASIPEKRWGVEGFKAIASFLKDHGYGVVVVGALADLADGDRITAEGGLNLAGQTSLAETAGVIARSELLVSGDSGLLHIAVGLGIPTVSLFGPGRALKWAPRGENHFVLNRQLDCSPCTTFGTTPHCPSKARCMQAITVTEVAQATIRLLNEKQK